jgi:hypothetical protein
MALHSPVARFGQTCLVLKTESHVDNGSRVAALECRRHGRSSFDCGRFHALLVLRLRAISGPATIGSPAPETVGLQPSLDPSCFFGHPPPMAPRGSSVTQMPSLARKVPRPIGCTAWPGARRSR